MFFAFLFAQKFNSLKQIGLVSVGQLVPHVVSLYISVPMVPHWGFPVNNQSVLVLGFYSDVSWGAP